MKLLSQPKMSWTMGYYGMAVEIPRYYTQRYIAIDRDGCVRLWTYEPKPYDASGCFQDEETLEESEDAVVIGWVDLQGADWRETRAEIAELDWLETHSCT